MEKWNGLKTSWDGPRFGLNSSFCEFTGDVDSEWAVVVDIGIIWLSPIAVTDLLVIVGKVWL